MSNVRAFAYLVSVCLTSRSRPIVAAMAVLKEDYGRELAEAGRFLRLVDACARAKEQDLLGARDVTLTQWMQICDAFDLDAADLEGVDEVGVSDFGNGPQLWMRRGQDRQLVP